MQKLRISRVNRAVTRVGQSDFEAFVRSRHVVVVLLARRPSTVFDPEVAGYLSDEYGGDVVLGRIDLSAIPHAGWATKHLGRPYPSDAASTADYALYLDGQLRLLEPAAVSDRDDGIHILASLALGAVTDSSRPMHVAARVINSKHAKRIIAAIEKEILAARARRPEKAAPAVASGDTEPASLEDCYRLLDVAPDAPDAEVESAYRAKIAQNHPDKVEHLDPELRRLAGSRTKALIAAMKRIRAARGRAR